MRKIIGLALMLLFVACSTNTKTQFKKDSDAYNLAKTLSEKVSYFNPDSNKVFLSTNEFDITAAEVVNQIQLNFGKQTDYLSKQGAANIQKIAREFSENIAMNRLSEVEASKNGITVSNAEVDSMFHKQELASGGAAKLDSALTLNGISADQIKKNLRYRIYIQKFVKSIKDTIPPVSDEVVQQAMSQDKTASVRHILLLTKGKSAQEKKAIYKKMQGILKKAKRGANFAKLASIYTEDPGSKKTGGLYENFGRGKMVPSFEAAAFSVPVGQISDIIETSYGYHILKVIDRKKDQRPKDQVAKELQQQSDRKVIMRAYDNLKKKYEVTLKIS